MHKKVSLTELVATKIIYALMLVSYYWMWARTDWEPWYPTAQAALGCFLLIFFLLRLSRLRKYKKENVDELAEHNLRICDALCLKLFIAVMIILAWACAILGHIHAADMGLAGWIIVLSILVLAIVRTVIFTILDRKGA